MEAVAHVANSHRAMSTSFLINYLTARRDSKVMSISAEINKIQKSLKVEVSE